MTPAFFTLNDTAIGTIEARGDQQERLEELTVRIAAGEFHHPTEVTIPLRCVDGRSPFTATTLAPNTAGGTESLFVADDLTSKRFGASDGSTLGGYKNILEWLQEHAIEIGGHTDTHAQGTASGCGANDKLSVIYKYIAEHGDLLRAVAGDLGIQVADETHEMILKNAKNRTSFSDGADLLQALKERADDRFVDRLEGDHREVVAAINLKPGTTLDRAALKEAFGDAYQAFNVDAWSFQNAAEAVSSEPAEIAQKVAAIVYYNLATTLVLAGPGMRVVVLK